MYMLLYLTILICQFDCWWSRQVWFNATMVFLWFTRIVVKKFS